MDYSWRHHNHPPPPTPGGAPFHHGTICPVCSISHFPFCPSQPPFPHNIHTHPSHHQYPPPPPPDQFYPPPPPQSDPLLAAPYDPFIDHRSSSRMNPYPIPADPQRPWGGANSGTYGNLYPSFDYSNAGGAKRIAIDDSTSVGGSKRIRSGNSYFSTTAPPPDPYMNENVVNSSSKGSSENERRLKLIREHGGIMDTRTDNSGAVVSNFDQDDDIYNNLKLPRQTEESVGYYYDHKGGFPSENSDIHSQFSQRYAMQHHMEPKLSQYGSLYFEKQGGVSNGMMRDSRLFSGQPPLPASPPPPLPMEPPGRHFSEPVVTPEKSAASLFSVPGAHPAVSPSSYPPRSEGSSLPSAYYPNKSHLRASITSFGSEEFQANWRAPPKIYLGGGNEVVPSQSLSPEKPKIIDASHIIKHPHRATRPDHIVVILRGLPGSGKSYLAKMLRDLEVENGGSVPRIYSMDDYFMTEVEKTVENEVSKSSASTRGKKRATKKVIEYCYEPEMEEAYRSSMLKAFKKTLDEGVFSFIIVDDRNLRVADFAQFWATAKRSGYEVYLLEAMYKDPAGCAARNVHGFSQDGIQKMADLWEEAPSLYLKLDIKSLLHGDGLEENGIQEVEMDMEDGDSIVGISVSEERNTEKVVVPHVEDFTSDGHPKGHERWDAEADHPAEEVKELGKSKWSSDLDEDNIHRKELSKGNLNALSGLIKSYNKEGKSVRWGDEVGVSGFSIAAAKTANVFALVIGPGAGYNLKSNPLSEEEKRSSYKGSKKHNVFDEQLRAERESFKAVFDKRRHRISGLASEDD